MFSNNSSRLLRTILSISLTISVLLFLQSLYFTSHDEIDFVHQNHALLGKLGWIGFIACIPISLFLVFVSSNMNDKSAKRHKYVGLAILIPAIILLILAYFTIHAIDNFVF